ncbi:MAG: hypothetical protein SP1CHLAM54_06040 [Chlamydiia bacterium]|nr:hypothetical protein [Chlamydiia bacterium]MCH9615514.1 hypothetical protein [Chlamydiia bacterium]MCH9629169.1 hypothetical protein [Chlamydiia bacterium]
MGLHVSNLGDAHDLNFGCQINDWQDKMREVNKCQIDVTGCVRPIEEFLFDGVDGEVSEELFEYVTRGVELVNAMGAQFGIEPLEVPATRFECTQEIMEGVHSRLKELQIHLNSMPQQFMTELQTMTQTYTIIIEALKGLNKAVCDQTRTMIQHMSQGT